jgi:ComF family protein
MEVKQLILSGSCFFCLSKTNGAWCIECEQDLVDKPDRCPKCAKKSIGKHICGACIKNESPINRTNILFDYQYPANQIIKVFKFKNRPELAKHFAHKLAERLINNNVEQPEALIPVPLHSNRQRARGYNQSLEISKHLSRLLGLSLYSTLCNRTKNTDPQSTLPIKTRRKNVKGAFALAEQPTLNHIVLVDDVITTGSTINEIASLFKRAGCQRIDVWAIARA